MPQNWKIYKLGEISTDISYGYTESASKEEIGPKFLRITDIQNDFISWDDVPYCNISDKNLDKYQLEIGDVVVARTGNSTGATAVIKDTINAVYASYLIRYRIDSSLCDPMYLDFILRSRNWADYVSAIKGGSAQPGANAKQFAEFEFQVPPLPEQRSIASILSSLDDKIELNLQMNKTLEEMAMTLYKHWFVDFGPFKYGEFIDSELGPIPEGWKVKRLSDVAKIIMGTSPKGDTYNDIGHGVPLINGPAQYGSFFPLRSKWTTKPTKLSKPNDLIFCVRGSTTGRRVLSDGEYCLGRGVCSIRAKNEIQEFVNMTIDFNLSRMLTNTTGSVFPNLTGPMIKEFPVVISPDSVLINFNKEVKAWSEVIWNNIHENKTLTALRDTLLPKLISGEVRVKDAEQTLSEVL